MNRPTMCTRCGLRPYMHWISHTVDGVRINEYLCCVCHVESGAPPADWHPLCMETYKKLKSSPFPSPALESEEKGLFRDKIIPAKPAD